MPRTIQESRRVLLATDERHTQPLTRGVYGPRPVTPQVVQGGSTEHFVVSYDAALGANGGLLSDAVLSSCEADYTRLLDLFGLTTVAGLPFQISIGVGSQGASHTGCTGTQIACDAFNGTDPDLARFLVVVEASEVFMANQGKGWNCGASPGEALSRVIGAEFYPGELPAPSAGVGPHAFKSADTWLSSTNPVRPDFVNVSDSTDRNKVSIGCGTLFINWLRFQMGFSLKEIVQAGGQTLAQTYQVLTGATDGFSVFMDLLNKYFPPGVAVTLADDNPFPLGLETFTSPDGTALRVAGLSSVAAHYSAADQRRVALVATSNRQVQEVYWLGQDVGHITIEGTDVLPVPFTESISAVASVYDTDQQRHLLFAGTSAGKVREVFWRSNTVGVEGYDDLPVQFGAGQIASMASLYDPDQKRFIVFVGTSEGKVHEIFWKSDTVGIEGHDDLPVSFPAGSIVSLAALYNSDDQRYVVLVATKQGTLHEIYWKAFTQGIEGHDELPATYVPSSIVSIAAAYNPNQKRHVVLIGLVDGSIHEVYWKSLTVGIEAEGVVTKIIGKSIVGLAALRIGTDGGTYFVTALSDGTLRRHVSSR